jgi:hypothetical protein
MPLFNFNFDRKSFFFFQFRPKVFSSSLLTILQIMMMKQELQQKQSGRWENGAISDSPLREVRIKALILKEQASTSEKMTPRKQRKQIKDSLAFDLSLHGSMSHDMSVEDKAPSLPVRSRTQISILDQEAIDCARAALRNLKALKEPLERAAFINLYCNYL